MKRMMIFLTGMAAFVGVVIAAVAGVPPIDFQATITSSGFMGEAGLPMLGVAGMIINKENLSSVFTGLKTIFNNTLKAEPGNWQKTTMQVPSTRSGEDHVWLSRFPKFRKWIGDKTVKSIKAGKYYVKNEDWETTLEVDRNDIEDDALGIYQTQASGAGEAAGELNDIISDDLKDKAFTETCMDGQFYYDTDHPVNDASVSNKGTAVLSAATLAAAKASYGLGREAIMGFKDEEDMPLRLVGDTLEVGPSQEAVAKILMTADKLQDDSPNPYKGTATVELNPAITDNRWMLHVTNKTSIKPFMIQMRKSPVFVQQTGMDSDDVFNRRKFKFGAEARATGFYGFWQLSYGSDGTV